MRLDKLIGHGNPTFCVAGPCLSFNLTVPVQLLLGHAKLGSTVRYLGIEIDDALEMSEQIDV